MKTGTYEEALARDRAEAEATLLAAGQELVGSLTGELFAGVMVKSESEYIGGPVDSGGWAGGGLFLAVSNTTDHRWEGTRPLPETRWEAGVRLLAELHKVFPLPGENWTVNRVEKAVDLGFFLEGDNMDPSMVGSCNARSSSSHQWSGIYVDPFAERVIEQATAEHDARQLRLVWIDFDGDDTPLTTWVPTWKEE